MSLWTEKDWWPKKQQYFALYFAFEADNFVDKTSVTKWSQGKPIAKEVKTMVSQKKVHWCEFSSHIINETAEVNGG